jgi:hypothetical protein
MFLAAMVKTRESPEIGKRRKTLEDEEKKKEEHEVAMLRGKR